MATPPLSLRLRLLLAAGLVLLLFLGVTGAALDAAFRSSVEDSAREQLRLRVLTLLGLADLGDDGRLELPGVLPEPRFNQPGSGLYARITDAEDRLVWSSRSLAGSGLEGMLVDAARPGTGEVVFDSASDDAAAYYLYRFGVLWEAPSFDERYVVSVIMAQAPFVAQARSFRTRLMLWFGGAGVLVLGVQLLVLTRALHPLQRVSTALKAVERGEADRLEGAWPTELAGLTRNLNLLIDHERARQSRYRTTLDDLAHALKTPLAILRNATGAGVLSEGALDTVREQVERMESIISHRLHRASLGSHPLKAPTTDLHEAARRIVGGLARIHGDHMTVEQAVPPGLRVAMDERDLYEVLGNLVENACKYGRSRALVRAEEVPGRGLWLTVEDDGPGVPPALRTEVLRRGARADTVRSGQGIGLAVVTEIVASYAGAVRVEGSELGGARVVVELPGAQTSSSVSASSASTEPSAAS